MIGLPASDDVERFRGIVVARLGLQFEDAKLGLLGDVLRKRAEADRRDCGRYLARLEAGPSRGEIGALAQELTVGETYFFRNPSQFDVFAETVLPARMRARRPERYLHFLSAGCASGEEAYTLAIIVKESIADPSWKVSISAVDINPAALERAASARFGPWALRETPHTSLERWFRPVEREFLLAEEIRSAVNFEQRNLTADDPDLWRPRHFDAVFCRNVIMYFSPEMMRALVARIAASLVPGGYLFLGHAETLRGLSQDFHLRHTHETFYYQSRIPGEEAAPQPALPVSPASRKEAPAAPPLNGETSWVEKIAQATERIQALGVAPAAAAPPPVASPKISLAHMLDLLRLERFSEALEMVRAMPREEAQDPDVLLVTAVLLAHSGEFAAVAEAATRLLAIDELNAGAHYVLALSCEAAGDHAGAVSHDHFAIYLDADFAMPRLHLGLLAKRSGDRVSARRELNQALLLLQREEASQLLLFGGGFAREGLVALCRAELVNIESCI
jgi:chemotaxis protein methyltransferase CheR